VVKIDEAATLALLGIVYRKIHARHNQYYHLDVLLQPYFIEIEREIGSQC
jgi:hypothetical protein